MFIQKCFLILTLFAYLNIAECRKDYSSIVAKYAKDTEIEYESMSTAIDYNLEILRKQWTLTTYSAIAEYIIKIPHQSLPYGVIRHLVRSANDVNKTLTMAEITEKMLPFEMPYLIMAGIPIVLAIVIPCLTLVLCIRRCLKKKKSEEDQAGEFEMVKKKKITRFISASIAMTAATFIFIGALASLFASERLDSSIEISSKMAETNIDNFIKMANTTFTVSHVLLEKDFSKIDSKEKQLVLTMSNYIVDHTTMDILKVVDKYLDALVTFEILMKNYKATLQLGESRRQSLVTLSQQLRTEIKSFDEDSQDFVTLCATKKVENSKYNAPCGKFESNYWNLQFHGNMSLIPPLSTMLTSTESILNSNISLLSNQTYREIYNLSNHLLETSQQTLKELGNLTNEVSSMRESLEGTFAYTSDLVVNKTLLPVKRKILEFNSNSWFSMIQLYISLVLKLPSFVMFMLCFLLFGGLAFGQFAAAHTTVWKVDELSPPMKLARTGRDLLISFVTIFLLFSIVINVMLSISLLTGANLTHVCNGLQDNSILNEVIDNNETWGGNLLGKIIHNDSNINIKLSEVLSNCCVESIWKPLKLDLLFDTTQILKIKEQLFDNFPPVEELIGDNLTLPLNGQYLPNMTILTPEEMGFSSYFVPTKLEPNMYTFHWQAFDLSLKDFQDEIYAVDDTNTNSEAFSENIYLLRTRFIGIYRDEYESFESELKSFNTSLKNLTQVIGELIVSINNVVQAQNEARDLFQPTKLEKFIIENFKYYLTLRITQLYNMIMQFCLHLFQQLTTRVGDCSFLPEMYDSIVALFCLHFTESVNAIWLSLGVLIFVTILSIPFIMTLMGHYKIISLDFESGKEATMTTASEAKLNHWAAVQIAGRKDCQWL